jgi:hypothetical protein
LVIKNNNNNDDFGSFLGKSQDGGIFKTSGCAQKKLCSKIKIYINFCKSIYCKCFPYYDVESKWVKNLLAFSLNEEAF